MFKLVNRAFAQMSTYQTFARIERVQESNKKVRVNVSCKTFQASNQAKILANGANVLC